MKSTVTVAAAHRFAAFILSVVVFYTSIAFAQETQPTPVPSPTVSAADARYLEMKKALEREKELAEIEAAIAKSRKDVLDAAPKPKSTPNTGDLTLSGEDIGYDIIVYRELGKTTTRIASSLQRTVPDSATIAIFDSSAFADWTFYRRSLPLFKIVIEDLTADYCLIANKSESDVKSLDLTSTGFATALAGAGNLVGQFADLLSYFKTQTTMTGKTVTIPEEAVVASLFSNLSQDNGLTLLYPKTFGLDAPVFCGQTTTARSCCAKGAGDCTETRPVYCSEVAFARRSVPCTAGSVRGKRAVAGVAKARELFCGVFEISERCYADNDRDSAEKVCQRRAICPATKAAKSVLPRDQISTRGRDTAGAKESFLSN